MPFFHSRPKSRPQFDHRKAAISLRWVLVILASYLTVFSYIGSPVFPVVFVAALIFTLSNITLMLIPRHRFIENKIQRAVAVLDGIFVSATLYFLRDPGNYLYIAFIAIFILAVIWRDLRLVLFSLLVVSLLYGLFSYVRFVQSGLDVNFEQFLTVALFFVVSIFYVFLSETLMHDALRSNAMAEDNRVAEVMVELTRSLSSSLSTDDVLYSIVFRLREVLEAEECSIVRIEPGTGSAKVIMKASNPQERNVRVDIDQYPELEAAYASRQLLFIPGAKPFGIIAIPMVVNETVLGLIDIRSAKLRPLMTEANARFLQVVGSTAANALRNAQLFEEVEHRARTDFLTGLPNHRSFQATFTVELGRAQRHNASLSLLIIDLDYLKEVNDRFGHPSGDMVIRTIAQTIRGTCRQIDFAARYGGEEFTMILPQTSLSDAFQAAERIRTAIAAVQFPAIGSITASIGISNYPVNALTKEDLIRVADQALYVAKKRGRDQVAYFDYQMITR